MAGINYESISHPQQPAGGPNPHNPPGPGVMPPQNYPSHSETVDVAVDQCMYPVTEDVLRQVFSRVGPVGVIQVRPNPNATPAPGCQPDMMGTVSFSFAQAAVQAYQQLNNQAIYPNSNFVRITLRHGAPPIVNQQPPQPYGNQGGGGYPPQMPQAPQMPEMPGQQAGDAWRGRGGGMRGGGMGGTNYQQGGQEGMFGGPGGMTGRGGMEQPHGGRGGRGGGPPLGMGEIPCYVQFGNVSPKVALFKLFALCEVYGTVITMRRQHTEKSYVIVQFVNERDGNDASHFLAGCPFFGGVLHTKVMANFVDRNPPLETTDADPMNPEVHQYDFTNAHHRAPRRPIMTGAPAPRKFKPSPNVFLTNLTEHQQDDEVRQALANLGASPVDYHRRHTNSALATFPSTEVAVEMLVSAHSFKIGSRYIKLLFSGIDPSIARQRGEEEKDQEGFNQHVDRAQAMGGRGSYGGPRGGGGGYARGGYGGRGAGAPQDSGW